MKFMKKLIILLTITALLFTSCGSGGTYPDNGSESDSGNGSENASTSPESDNTTLGDTSGDGMIEDSSNNEPNLMSEIVDSVTGMGKFESVDSVTSADDAVNFIGSNVYSICGDAIPLITETRTVKSEDLKNVSVNSLIPDTSGIRDVILSESLISAFPYTLLMLRCDGENMLPLSEISQSDIPAAMSMGVSTETVSAITLDNDVIFVMGSPEQVDSVMNAVVEASAGVYTNIGEVISIVG